MPMNPLWQEVWTTIRADFSDLPGIAQVTQITVRLLLAALCGGLLGFERERAGKEAGLRTHMLVALGAAFFVLIPQQAGISPNDMSRVLQGVISGIGFLGAGTILKLNDREEVRGLTTAACIWLTAAVGIAAGMGREASAVLCTLLALVILSLLPRIAPKPNSPESIPPQQSV
jgi:putative Mg2+ transporter-C (MgtC) family protein